MFTIPPHHGPQGLGFINELSKLRAEWLNYVGGVMPQALDAVGGGYYQFAGDIRLSANSYQFKVNAAGVSDPIALLGYVTIGVTDDSNYALGVGSLTVASAATFTSTVVFSSGVTYNGAMTFNAPVTFTSNGDITLQSGCVLTGASGSSLTMASGSTTTISGTAAFNGTTSLNAATTVDAAVTFTSNGPITANALATFTKSIVVNSSTTNTAAIPQKAITANGYISLGGVNPNADVTPSADNPVYPLSVCKAYAVVQLGTGGPYTPQDSYNIDTITDVATGIYQVTFLRQMLDSAYSITVTGNAHGRCAHWQSPFVDTFQIHVFDTTTGALDGSTITVGFQVFGRM